MLKSPITFLIRILTSCETTAIDDEVPPRHFGKRNIGSQKLLLSTASHQIFLIRLENSFVQIDFFKRIENLKKIEEIFNKSDENTKIAENVKPWYIIKKCETIHPLKNMSITNFT